MAACHCHLEAWRLEHPLSTAPAPQCQGGCSGARPGSGVENLLACCVEREAPVPQTPATALPPHGGLYHWPGLDLGSESSEGDQHPIIPGPEEVLGHRDLSAKNGTIRHNRSSQSISVPFAGLQRVVCGGFVQKRNVVLSVQSLCQRPGSRVGQQ